MPSSVETLQKEINVKLMQKKNLRNRKRIITFALHFKKA